jgi:uncharacterized protein
MAKPVGPICNLNCTYCFYLDKDRFYGKRQYRMSDQVLEEYIKQYIQASQVPAVSFAWQGGEPTLLGVEFFRKAVELQKKYADGKQISNAFQTNGTLLDDQWGEFLSKEQFLIGLSIDGPKELHDHYRVSKGGKGSFDQVLRGLDVLHRHNVEYNTLTVVNDVNVRKPMDVYDCLKGIGSKHWQFIPIVERLENADNRQVIAPPPEETGHDEAYPVSAWSAAPRLYGQFMASIFDRWYQKDIGQIFIQTFENTLAPYMGVRPGVCVYSETCGEALIIEHNGDVYSCDHYVFPQYKLGNILEKPLAEMVESQFQLKFGCDKRDQLPRDCKQCKWLHLCHGGCPKDRFAKDLEGTHRLNYLCPGFKVFYNHIDARMQKLAATLKQQQPAGYRW